MNQTRRPGRSPGGEPPAGWIIGRALERLAPALDLRTVRSELRELYRARRERDGADAAGRWYRRQLRRYAAHLLLDRLRSVPHLGEFMRDLIHGLRLTLRRLLAAPAFTVTCVLTLALGIGAATAVFTVVNGVLLRPLPYPDPDSLVGLWHVWPGQVWQGQASGAVNMSPALFFTYREEGRVFEDMGMWDRDRVTVRSQEGPVWTPALIVSDSTLHILGASPSLGRLFSREDDTPGTPLTVVVSNAYWREQLGADPEVIGRPLEINDRSREIIGVLPPGFRFLDVDADIYLPFRFDRGTLFVGNFSYQALARLRPGFGIDDANADIERMIPLATEKFPRGLNLEMLREGGFGAAVHPLRVDVVGDVGTALWLLLGTVGIVLVVACANVANLVLVRAEGQHVELALRSALGASRARLRRESLTQSLVLGSLGGLAGVGLARGGVALLLRLAPDGLPRQHAIGMDPRVLLFATAVTVLTALLFGLFPTATLRERRFNETLREGGRGSTHGRERLRLRNGLVVAQTALALVLLIGSGLMVRSFAALLDVQPGFTDPERILTFRVPVSWASIDENAEAVEIHRQIRERIAALPGVETVGLTSSATMDGWDSNDSTHVDGFPTPDNVLPPSRRYKWISPEYFAAMGNPLLAGRTFTWQDIHDRAPVAIITRNFALEYWDSPAAALGQRIRENTTSPWRTIVGVVGDVHDDGLGRPATTVVYWPMLMDDFWGSPSFTQANMRYVVRSDRAGTRELTDAVRRAVWAVDSSLPLANVETMRDILGHSAARTAFTLVMLGIAAAMAVLLGAVGIYGVTSYVVSNRTPEIGMRMALGARRQDVSGMVVLHGLRLAGIGMAIGLVGALGGTRLMSAMLFGVSPVDPATYAAAAVGVALLAAAASYLPARRAAGLDPMRALRQD